MTDTQPKRTPVTRRALVSGLLGGALACLPDAYPQGYPQAAARPHVPFTGLSVPVNGLRFPLLRWGRPDTAPMLLIHGFPQEPLSWQPLAEALAHPYLGDAGFQLIAPWQRGYATSNRAGPYQFNQFVSDNLHIADRLHLERFDVAGFGIGGAVAFLLAAAYPGRVRSVISLRFPHPAAFAQAMQTDPAQRQKWHALEQALGTGDPSLQASHLLAHGAAGLRRLLSGAGLSGPTLERYVRRMRAPGALAAALSWEHAVSLESFAQVPAVQCPALMLWSEGPGVSQAATEATRAFVRGQFRSIELEGHFFLENAPQSVIPPITAWMHALQQGRTP